jgi:hypothetical protein
MGGMEQSFSDTSLLQHLESLSLQLNIEVRYENLSDEEIPIHSGGCKLSGRNLIIIDLHLPFMERARILATELSRYDLEVLYILPRVREFILIQKSPEEKGLSHR